MGCTSCGSSPGGCQNNGNCGTGGCNKLNTFDWLTDLSIPDPTQSDLIEVSFRNGSRKGFYRRKPHMHGLSGELVVVEAESGYDIGKVALTGDLVKLQMKKKGILEEAINHHVLRIANPRDIERLTEARSQERDVMIKSRVLARSLDLEMKVGDVEYQADKRKATFYYTAEGRVDFRELIKLFAREFRVKIEMRQIGARQESSRIGGIGSCGRELCCSTWLTNFKSVSTAAARYQNLAINQSKLSGQCGRLKCCLNYELDTYLDALKSFPRHADKLETEAGVASLVKTDIFRGLMFYVYNNSLVNKFYPVPVKRVKEIIELNKKGKKPNDLHGTSFKPEKEEETGFVELTGEIELPPEERKRRNSRNKRRSGGKGKGGGQRRKPQGNSNNRNKDDRNKDPKGKDTRSKDGRSKDTRNKDTRSKDNKSRDNRNKPSGNKSPNKSGSEKQSSRNKSDNRKSNNKPSQSGEAKGNRKPDNRKPRPQNRKSRAPRKPNDKPTDKPTDKPKD